MSIKQNILKPVLTLILKILRVFPIKDNKVLFSSFSARSFSDNPKYIAEYMNDLGSYDCVVVLEHPERFKLPDGIRSVKYNSLKYLYEVATAHIWIDNTRKQDFLVKRSGQFYLQTWHGSIALKKIEKDTQESLDKRYIKTAKHDSSMMNLMITDSDWSIKMFKRCFWFDGPIIKTGSPRLDNYISQRINVKEVREKIHLDNNKKILLYAPTFRNVDTDYKNVYNIDFLLLKKNLQIRFGGDWEILVKLHPNISSNHIKFSNNVIDVSLYPDIMELYAISDALITDYSSTMFDFSFLPNKYVFLYANDVKEYMSQRGMYFDIKKLPFSLSENNDELENNIINFNEKSYSEKLNTFYNNLGILEDGNATERVVKLIEKIE